MIGLTRVPSGVFSETVGLESVTSVGASLTSAREITSKC